MKKKKNIILLALIIFSIFLISATSQKNKGDIVYINAFALQGDTSEIEVSKLDTVIIRKGWAACTKGLLLDYQDALTYQHYVLTNDGETLGDIYGDDGKWGDEPESITGDLINLCYWDVDEMWKNYWTYNLSPKLPKVGDYELFIEFETTKTVSDGYDGNQDGEIDIYAPYSMDGHTVTIHVTK